MDTSERSHLCVRYAPNNYYLIGSTTVGKQTGDPRTGDTTNNDADIQTDNMIVNQVTHGKYEDVRREHVM